MSRNLCRTDCYFCHGVVTLVAPPRAVTEDDCGVYFSEYEGLVVAEAECIDCEAKYLARVDESKRVRYASRHDPGVLFSDLSFRSTFNDEPGERDLPKWQIRETVQRERVGPFDLDRPFLVRRKI